MCCRYYIGGPTVENLAHMAGADSTVLRMGDIRPTELAPIITAERKTEKPLLTAMHWGFLPEGTGNLVINARAETVPQKRLFRNGFMEHRCLVPASGFYEWDAKKNKHTFTIPDAETFYMAGIFDLFRGEKRFTIITTAANDSMMSVHDRMPLIIPGVRREDWLRDPAAAAAILNQPSAILQDGYQEMQYSLF